MAVIIFSSCNYFYTRCSYSILFNFTKNDFLCIFLEFCLKVSEGFFDRVRPGIFVVIVYWLCTVFLDNANHKINN